MESFILGPTPKIDFSCSVATTHLQWLEREQISYDCAVHSFGLMCSQIFHIPLADPALWTAYRHDSAERNQQDFAKNNLKIFLLGHNKNWA
jgi:hypothetical protein